VPVWVQLILVVIGLLLGASLMGSWWRDRY
jgi:hypothetical protein